MDKLQFLVLIPVVTVPDVGYCINSLTDNNVHTVCGLQSKDPEYREPGCIFYPEIPGLSIPQTWDYGIQKQAQSYLIQTDWFQSHHK